LKRKLYKSLKDHKPNLNNNNKNNLKRKLFNEEIQINIAENQEFDNINIIQKIIVG